MTLKIRIRKHERGLRFRYGDYKQLLEPGTYWLLSRLWSAKRDTVDVVSTLATKLEHPMLEAILNPRNADAKLSAQVEVINLSDTQRALIWRDGRLFAIVGPGRHAFWKTPYKLDIETFDVETLRFTHAKLETILLHCEASRWL